MEVHGPIEIRCDTRCLRGVGVSESTTNGQCGLKLLRKSHGHNTHELVLAAERVQNRFWQIHTRTYWNKERMVIVLTTQSVHYVIFDDQRCDWEKRTTEQPLLTSGQVPTVAPQRQFIPISGHEHYMSWHIPSIACIAEARRPWADIYKTFQYLQDVAWNTLVCALLFKGLQTYHLSAVEENASVSWVKELNKCVASSSVRWLKWRNIWTGQSPCLVAYIRLSAEAFSLLRQPYKFFLHSCDNVTYSSPLSVWKIKDSF